MDLDKINQLRNSVGTLMKDWVHHNPETTFLVGGMALSAYFIRRNRHLNASQTKLTDLKYSEKSPLTYDEATHRSKSISRAEYMLVLNLKPGATYEGKVIIEFDLAAPVAGLFVDYFGKHIKRISLNEKNITSQEHFVNHRVHLPLEHLKAGLNKVSINFENDYANDASGLHSFTDTDGKQYIYSQCEPCYAHKIFPCFDQPDMKASLRLRMITPKSWKVIGNEIIENSEEATEDHFKNLRFSDYAPDLQITKFKRTPHISTYLYAFIAGPYEEIPNLNSYKSLKMSLYSRQSVAKAARSQAQMMFDVTCAGMKYYEELFDIPFVFSKYDLIFCPEFNWGAMENVGAVTFSETAHLHKDGMTDLGRLGLAYVLLHELAHMWFGNLVTMKWWDDLWLNESFATFIGYYTLENHPELQRLYPNAWMKFFLYKENGYTLDQLSTTHAIACHVDDTAQAETRFDGITYSKGAAVLKQLVYKIGFENFRDAMRNYFKLHKWRNADLQDFFAALKKIVEERKLRINLDEWKDEWICTAGVNELNAFLETREDGLKLTIVQSSALKAHSRLRDHKVKAGFYYDDGSCRVLDIDLIDEAINELHIRELPAPNAILLNYDDEDYVKARIDHVSLHFFSANLHKIKEPLTRALVWKCLSDMTKDGKIKAWEYLDFSRHQALNEEQTELSRNILATTKNVISNYLPNDVQPTVASAFFENLYNTLLEHHKNFSSTRKILYMAYLPAFADKPEDALKLAQVFEHGSKLFGNPNLATKLHILRVLTAKGLLTKAERDRLYGLINDNSNILKNERRRLDVLEINDFREREKLWETFIHPPSDLSTKVLQVMMEGFNHPEKSLKNLVYIRKYFDILLNLYERTTYDYFSTFYHALFPIWCENFDEILGPINMLLEIVPKKYTQFTQMLTRSKEQAEIMRRNKCLSAMDRAQASQTYSWIKAAKYSIHPVTTHPEEFVSVTRDVEVDVVEREKEKEKEKASHRPVFRGQEVDSSPVVQRITGREDESIHLQSADQHSDTKDLTVEEVSMTQGEQGYVADKSFADEERKHHEHEDHDKVHDLGASNFSDTYVQVSNLGISGLKDSYFRQDPNEDGGSRNKDLRITFDEGKELGDSSLFGEEELDDEEATKLILGKNWKKQSPFVKHESVFKDWVANTRAVYTAMFKADCSKFSVSRYISPETDVKPFLDNVLRKHYIKLVHVFLYYQSESHRFPEISWLEFSNLCKSSKKVFGATLTNKDLDQIFIQETKESPKKLENLNKDRSICRYEFIDIILRMGIKKYMGKKEVTTYNGAIDKFLEQDFFPNVKTSDYSYEGYRYEKIHTEEVDNVLKAHQDVLRKVFDKFRKNEAEILHLDEIRPLLTKENFGVLAPEVLKCFALSKMMIIDETQEGIRSREVLVFPEFLEFVVRIAEITVEAEFSTANKIEALIPKFAATL